MSNRQAPICITLDIFFIEEIDKLAKQENLDRARLISKAVLHYMQYTQGNKKEELANTGYNSRLLDFFVG